MPTITNPTVVQTIVQNYLLNGLDKCNALLQTGYKLNYARSTKGMKLFEREDVKAELRRQRVELAKKTGFTKEQASVDLDEDRQLARELKQPAAAITATNAKMRLYGMDQIAGTDATVIVISPPSQPPTPVKVENEVITETKPIPTDQIECE